VDVPEAPKIVIERPAPCADLAKAEELLDRALAPALAPRGAWSVIARFSRKGASLTVEGEITDEVDAPVAHRVLTQPGRECASLARAVGVWAALVLDAEVERAARALPPSAQPAPNDPPPPPPLVEALPEDKPVPEASLLVAHSQGERTLEVGLSMFLMGGTASGVIAGPTLFGVVEAGQGWFFRPALYFGQTLDGVDASNNLSALLVEARFDACGRIAGFYIERHGIQLDVCGGVEGGISHIAISATYAQRAEVDNPALFAAGPSMSLRGELGNGLALMIRGVMDYNVIRETLVIRGEGTSPNTDVSPSVLLGRGEVGLSWQLR
jgi:hypothetical protein